MAGDGMNGGAGAGMAGLIAAILTLGAGDAAAQAAGGGGLIGADVRSRVNGVLQVLTFAAIPDPTAASLAISSDSTDDPRFQQTQIGGAFTVGDGAPVYLEGYIGATRYDPSFVFSRGEQERRLPTRWNAVTATGGVGYDIPLSEHWVVRPIGSVMLGYVASDLRIAEFLVDRRIDPEIDFLDGGDLWAGGLGGALMLDYAYASPAFDADLELRYSAIRVANIGESTDSVEGSADGQTANVWARLRVPTGARAFGGPLRTVFEAAHSSFFGPTRGALGFTDLTQLGLGIEIDTEGRDIVLKRTRLVGRVVFGENVRGFGLGVGVGF